MRRFPYIETNKGITVVLDNKPVTVSADHPLYDEVVDKVVSGDFDAIDIQEVLERASKKIQAAVQLTPDMEYSGGVVLYMGEVLHNYATARLVAMVDKGQDVEPLAKFLSKLMDNPSKRVVDNLYAFLEHGNIPLHPDGDFLVYKAVRADFKDIHSGRFDNSIGEVVTMPRNQVDEDQSRTCSAGLHVCSFDYLPHFAHAQGHVVICKVSPADVVAIPADYNNTKMRVSGYEVVGEVEDYYGKKDDVLGDIGRDSGVATLRFRVSWGADNDFSSEDTEEEFAFLPEARREASRLFESLKDSGEEGVSVEVVDQDTDEVVFAVNE